MHLGFVTIQYSTLDLSYIAMIFTVVVQQSVAQVRVLYCHSVEQTDFVTVGDGGMGASYVWLCYTMGSNILLTTMPLYNA